VSNVENVAALFLLSSDDHRDYVEKNVKPNSYGLVLANSDQRYVDESVCVCVCVCVCVFVLC
jgi:hypothetical protein